jgi:hypothetical protein
LRSFRSSDRQVAHLLAIPQCNVSASFHHHRRNCQIPALVDHTNFVTVIRPYYQEAVYQKRLLQVGIDDGVIAAIEMENNTFLNSLIKQLTRSE